VLVPVAVRLYEQLHVTGALSREETSEYRGKSSFYVGDGADQLV
jgi:hypothetical protein